MELFDLLDELVEDKPATHGQLYKEKQRARYNDLEGSYKNFLAGTRSDSARDREYLCQLTTDWLIGGKQISPLLCLGLTPLALSRATVADCRKRWEDYKQRAHDKPGQSKKIRAKHLKSLGNQRRKVKRYLRKVYRLANEYSAQNAEQVPHLWVDNALFRYTDVTDSISAGLAELLAEVEEVSVREYVHIEPADGIPSAFANFMMSMRLKGANHKPTASYKAVYKKRQYNPKNGQQPRPTAISSALDSGLVTPQEVYNALN